MTAEVGVLTTPYPPIHTLFLPTLIQLELQGIDSKCEQNFELTSLQGDVASS